MLLIKFVVVRIRDDDYADVFNHLDDYDDNDYSLSGEYLKGEGERSPALSLMSVVSSIGTIGTSLVFLT